MDVSQIESLDVNELNQTLICLGAKFDKFATDLANGSIKELAPPFADYHSYKGSIISYYRLFFEKYLRYLDDIDENTWKFVNISMTAYIKKYSENHITVGFDLKSECKRLMNSILNSVSEYYNGAPNKAFESLRNCFIDNNGHLLNLIPQIQYKGNLYRVRNKANLKENKELFHTPFELRTKCGSYRFSILGYPSLYLSLSLDTSLKETDINSENYTACRFYPQETLQY